MEQYLELSQLMERVIHKYNRAENVKRLYGTDMPLTRTEIHTIVAVGDHLDINITSLAKLQGITKGAASQMIYKLVDKGFIEKRVSPNSDTEVCLRLTQEGARAYEKHQAYHDNANERFFQMMRDMPEEFGQELLRMLREFDRTLDERIEDH